MSNRKIAGDFGLVPASLISNPRRPASREEN